MVVSGCVTQVARNVKRGGRNIENHDVSQELNEPERVHKNKTDSRRKMRQQQRFTRDRRRRTGKQGQLSQFGLVGREKARLVGQHGDKKRRTEQGRGSKKGREAQKP